MKHTLRLLLCPLIPSGHFLLRATSTQGTIIKCANISLAPLCPLISSFPVLETLLKVYPVSTSNPHDRNSRPRPQSNFQSPKRQGSPLGLNVPKHSFGAPQMNAKFVGAGTPGASPPPSGRVCAAPPSRPPASLLEPSAACALHWSALSLERQGCLGLQEDKGHLLRNTEARHR